MYRSCYYTLNLSNGHIKVTMRIVSALSVAIFIISRLLTACR